MENQHKKITGYRDLSQEEINTMNAIKAMGEGLGEMVADMESNPEMDQRWVAIGKTHLQQGVMALVRAVAQPNSF